MYALSFSTLTMKIKLEQTICYSTPIYTFTYISVPFKILSSDECDWIQNRMGWFYLTVV